MLSIAMMNPSMTLCTENLGLAFPLPSNMSGLQPGDLQQSLVSPTSNAKKSANQKHCMISRDQWNSLRSTIKNLYLLENRTIENTSAYVAESHGFKPT